ncbi:MAG: alkaline phosphatase family protein [Candidatus Eisenbacteria bacterium]|nr:alkaline phosphatase family protein [Candidatus Eisenbacteria bacterium]
MGRVTLWVSLLWGLAFGVWETNYFTRTNQLFPVGAGHAAVAILIGIGYALLALSVSGVACLAYRRWKKRLPALPYLPGVWALLLVLALSQYRERMDTRTDNLQRDGVTLLIAAAVLALFFVFRSVLSKRPRFALSLFAGVALLGIVAGGARLGVAAPPRTAPPPEGTGGVEQAGGIDETGLRVLIVGLDGGTWEILDPMIERGELPALAALCDRGVSANLKVVLPSFSPPLWTSIATGKSADKHGVHDHYRTALPLGLPPVPHQIRRCPTWTKPVRMAVAFYEKRIGFPTVLNQTGDVLVRPVWDILDQYGFPTIMLDWYVTYPVPPSDGIHVSDQLHKHKLTRSPVPGLAWPEEIVPSLLEKVIAPDELDENLLFDMLDAKDLDAEGRAKLREDFPKWFRVARSEMARDLSNVEVARAVFPMRPDWRLGAVFFRAMDNSHHLAWRMKDLPAGDLDRYPERRFRTVVENNYRHCDRLLQSVLDIARPDSNTVVIVLSDHGWENAQYGHSRAPDGFLVMAGGPTAPTPERRSIHVYEIAPTVLALLGMPVGADMDGGVAREFVEDSFWARHPIREIPTYETGRKRADGSPNRELDDESMELLRALGYVN